MDPVRERCLRVRARIVQAIRAFFVGQGYLEMETPHRVPAPIPEAHIDPVPCRGGYLHTSPEVCMKRLLAAGLDRIFQVCRCWREGERGRLHLPEFTMLEWYRTGVDYRDLMAECEALIPLAARAAGKGEVFTHRGRRVDARPPWPRLRVDDAFEELGGVAVGEAIRSGAFEEVLVSRVEPALAELGRPVFLVDYPLEQGALARACPDRPGRVERFELYAGGLELANGFSELVDPVEQRARFEAEQEARLRRGREVAPMPEPFLRDLAGVPPAAGIALGVDRLVMLLTNAGTIDEVVAFVPEEL